jgi:hypothetical protein
MFATVTGCSTSGGGCTLGGSAVSASAVRDSVAGLGRMDDTRARLRATTLGFRVVGRTEAALSACLLPWRTPQAASRFASLLCALRLRCILLAALRSLCCGSACTVPRCARSTLLALFAVGLSIALQTQQRACQPFYCGADVDT